MVVNKQAFWITLVLTLISISVMVVFIVIENEIGISIMASLFTGGLIGMIIPLVTFFDTRKKMEIRFYNLCYERLAALKKIEKSVNQDLPSLAEKYGKLKRARKQENIDMNCYLEMVEPLNAGIHGIYVIIKEYSNNPQADFYSIIDDYCGLWTMKKNKIKQEMFLIRDAFAKFNYYKYERLVNIVSELDIKYYTDKCINRFLIPYTEETKLGMESCEEILGKINNFINMTQLTKYTAKRQGVKK